MSLLQAQVFRLGYIDDALAAIVADSITQQAADYFPIQLNFDVYKNTSVADFYDNLYQDIREEIEHLFQRRGVTPSETLIQFLEGTTLTNHHAMRRFLGTLIVC